MVAAARSKDTDTFWPARGKVIFLVGKIGWDRLVVAETTRAL
jgi:hypothetical protein